MGRATERLKKEHAAIETRIKILGSIRSRLRAEERIDPEYLDRICLH